MKKSLLFALSLIATVCALLLSSMWGAPTALASSDSSLPPPQNSTQTLDQTVALVNDAIITQSQVDQAYRQLMREMASRRDAAAHLPPPSALKQMLLQQLIDQELQMQLAQRNGIEVTNQDINLALANLASAKKISISTLQQEAYADGLTRAQLRTMIQKQITLERLQYQALSEDIKVSDDEVNARMKKYLSQRSLSAQYHLLDIIITLPSAPTTTQSKQAHVEALQVLAALQAGQDASKIKGVLLHDLGWRTLAELPDLFVNALEDKKAGDIIGPLRAANGHHVLKILAIQDMNATLPTQQEVLRQIQAEKLRAALPDWIKKLRETAYVSIIHPQ